MTEADSKSGTSAFDRVRFWGALVVIVISIVVMYVVLPVDQVTELLEQWVGSLGAWGPVVFGLIYVATCLVLLPASLLTFIAGAVFGVGVGALTVWLASVVGATLAFLAARYLVRDTVEAKARGNATFAAVDDAVCEGSWKIVAMLRFSPAVPFTYQNYLLGITGLKLVPYVLTSAIAMLPATVMYVYLGAAGGAAASGGLGVGQWVLFAVGLAATLALTVYLARLAKKKLNEQTEGNAGDGDEHESGDDAEQRDDRNEPDEPEDPEKDDPMKKNSDHPSGSKWKLPAAALFMAVLAGCAVVARGPLARLAGPPAVTMEESYSANPGGPAFDHSAFDGLLKSYVNAAGLVDYPGLTEEKDVLDDYIATIREAPFDALGRDEKLALLINAYNAFTLRLMIDHPGIDSIQSIPDEKRWDDPRWYVAGKRVTLKQVENEEIRPHFIEPRIHWAVVCAAIGCPPLRNEAYVADRLDEQLDAQSRRVFTRGTRWYQVSTDEKTIQVTPIMQWYGGDFKQVSGGVPQYVAQYDGSVKDLIDRGSAPKETFLKYDWTLNSQANEEKAGKAAEAAASEGEGG